MDYDVIVIGGGIAGTLAAINAAKTAKVAVVRKGYGATALSYGAFDIAGGAGTRGRPLKGLMHLAEGIENILANEPRHPYSILSASFKEDRINGFSDMIKTVGDRFFGELEDAGLRYEGSWENNMLLPNQHGTFKVTSFCQASIASGNLAKLMGRAILFVGFTVGAAHNKTRALFLSDILSRYGLRSFKDLSCTGVDLGSAGITCNVNRGISLAAMMDNENEANKVLTVMRQALDTKRYDHIFIPPVMGIANHTGVAKMFADTFGDSVSEFLASPPSAPGLRLQYALDRLLATHGVTVIDGTASCDGAADPIKDLRVTRKDGKTSLLSAKSFVLSTGKFISSGIENGGTPACMGASALRHEGTWHEAVFGLPVFIGTHPVKDSPRSGYTTPDPFDDQPFFSMGVSVDGALRPVDAEGRVVHGNLFAAGSVLSGYNYIYDKTGMGTAMITGTKAGILCVDYI